MATVLHIEDDAASRLLVRKLLQAAGHEVVDADSGLQGIRLAEATRPDLVLVDINVPDLDGYEVTLRLPDAARRHAALAERGIVAGHVLERDEPALSDTLLLAATELTTDDDIARLVAALEETR